MKTKTFLAFAAVISMIIAMNIHNFMAFFWKSENATVMLAHCQVNCELKGTLTVIPFDGRYKLQNEEGETIFSEGSIRMIILQPKPFNQPD